MKKSYRIIGIANLLLIFILMFTACPPFNPENPENPVNTTTSAEAVQAGIQSLKAGQWEQALNSFSQAVALDPDNGEAQLWYSMLNIASISVDANLVDLARNRLKFKNYPDTMDSLYSGDWITMNIHYSDNYAYVNGELVITPVFALFPEIDVPQQIALWSDGDDTVITNSEYILAFLYNFTTANPNGFNELVDGVVNDVLGPRLDAAVVWLHNLNADFSITFTWDMFTDGDQPPAGWPMDADQKPLAVKIGKAELLAEAAQLQTIRSLLSLFRSYNLTLPLTAYYNTFNPVNGTMDLAALASPLASGFLYGRPEAAAILSQAKSAMQGAITDMLTALDGILSDRPGMFISSSNSLFADSWDYIADGLNYAKIFYTKMQASVNDNQTIIIPVPDFSFPPDVYFDTYSIAANWPTASDWGGFASGPPTAIGVNYGKIFSGTIFAIDALIELQPDGENVGEPVWYRCGYTVFETDDIPYQTTSVTLSTTPVSSLNSTAAAENNVIYAFKIKDLTLGGLIDLNEGFISELRTQIKSMTGDADLDNKLVVENPDGSVSFYVPQVPPCFAYESFAAAGEALAVDYGYTGGTYNYTTKGSFWWSLPELVLFMQTYMVIIEDMVPGTPLENVSINANESLYFRASVTPGTYYNVKINNVAVGGSLYTNIYKTQERTFPNQLVSTSANENLSIAEIISPPNDILFIWISNSSTATTFNVTVEPVVFTDLTPNVPLADQTLASSEIRYYLVDDLTPYVNHSVFIDNVGASYISVIVYSASGNALNVSDGNYVFGGSSWYGSIYPDVSSAIIKITNFDTENPATFDIEIIE